MSGTPRFAVMGSGNGARAFCGQIAALGLPVRMFEPLEATADFLKLKQEPEIFLEGDIRVKGRLDGVTMDAGEAMEGAGVVLVVVPSFAHPSIFSRMIPHLKDGTHVIIVPGNYGGLLLKKMMAEAGCKARVAISETASRACSVISPGERNREDIEEISLSKARCRRVSLSAFFLCSISL